MKTRFLLVLLVPFLWSCATAETRPAVNASAFLFDLDVSVDPQLAKFSPDVAKGGGSGMLRGAGMGAGGCIYMGASIDGASGGSSMLLGTALGIFVSPACALVGSAVGGGLAETKEDVASRTAALNDVARELGYPTELARILVDDMKSGRIYHIAGTPEGEAWSKDTSGTSSWQSDDGYFEPKAETRVAVTPALLVANGDQTFDTGSGVVHEGDADENIVAAVVEDAELAPIVRPTEPNGSIHMIITNYGFVGKGIDPKLPLQISAKVCVTQYETGEAMAFQTLMASSKAMKLEDWAVLGKEGFEAETQSLLGQISKKAHAVMGRQVKLGYKTSCGKKGFGGRLVEPMG